MGVRGFTTYMSKRSHIFLEYFELKNCYLIIDGSGIAISLYMWHTRSNDCFGGDYDLYANTVYKFFDLLKKCNVIPIILFDGGYENRKMKTVFSRMKNRMNSIKNLNKSSGRDVKVFPLFTKEIFQDIAMSLGIKCIRNDHESDSEIACLGKYLNCPILGYDSDFYFFDVLYVPFNKFEMKTSSRHNRNSRILEYYIPCEVYRIDNFLNHFGGLDKTNVPLLPALLGNDYIKKSMFSAFYNHIKLKKSGSENEQQRLIKTVISWLQHETLESAIAKILGRFKAKKRRFISYKLQSAMKGYLQRKSTLCKYLEDFKEGLHLEENFNIDIFSIEPECEDGENIESNSDISDCDESEVSSMLSDTSDLNEVNEPQSDFLISDSTESLNIASEDLCFIDSYRQCLLPQCFADIKWKNIYFCVPLIENYDDPNSHKISLNIVASIQKILNPLEEKPLTCIMRSGGNRIRRERQEKSSYNSLQFYEIQNLDHNKRKLHFFQIMEVDEGYQEFLQKFPGNWHLFLLSLIYWKKKSEKIIDSSYIYSLIICAIFLNIVDSRIGFCRSQKSFDRKFKMYNTNTMTPTKCIPTESILESLENIGYEESLLCSKALMKFFCVQPKKAVDKKLNKATIVGYFSEFQSCALHVKYLNSLLGFPFENALFSKFFNGTFLYNAVIDFRRRSNLKSYLEILLKDCKTIGFSVHLIFTSFEQCFGVISESEAKKRRKRKKKQHKREITTNQELIDL